MTIDGQSVPFIVRYGRAIVPPTSRPAIGYDVARQEGLVLEQGIWVRALDAVNLPLPATLTTEVKVETTDNQ